eukprot:6457580-Pyramimonas_sp.AAC.1
MSTQPAAALRCAWRPEPRPTSCYCIAVKRALRGTTRLSSGPRARWRAGCDSARGISHSFASPRGARASRAAGAFLAAVLRRVVDLLACTP